MRAGLKIDFEAEAERGETQAEEVRLLELTSEIIKGFADEIAKWAHEEGLEVSWGMR